MKKIQHQLKVDQLVTLTIRRLGINGEGIGYYDHTIIFVPQALPKEKVKVKIVTIANKYATGEIIRIFKPSPNRIEPPCEVYSECGGCQLQHLDYPQQLLYKHDLIKQSLVKFKPKNYQNFKILPTIGMKEPWYYRNKAQFQVRRTKQNKVVAGLYQTDSHQLVPITNCLVQYPLISEIINFVTALAQTVNLPIYDEKQNSGILKTIMVRESLMTHECQVVFITHSRKLPHKKQLIEGIQNKFPTVVSVVQNVQAKKTSQVMGEESLLLWGKAVIEEHLNEIVFQLSANAFFQLNTAQTLRLYEEVKQALNIQPDETVVDAYCGVGTIGLFAAQSAKEIRGMDVIPSAIEDAKRNAKQLNLTNTHYEVGAAEKTLPTWKKNGFQPDAMLVDPPRTGLDSQLLRYLVKEPVKKLVYVSCNPSTLARDLKELANVYHIKHLQPLDMFPQTARVEVIATLCLK